MGLSVFFKGGTMFLPTKMQGVPENAPITQVNTKSE
jgi:hypothetical protein